MVSYNDQSILLYDHNKLWDKVLRKTAGDHSAFSTPTNDSSFVLISKIDGKVLEYVEVPSPVTNLRSSINYINSTGVATTSPTWSNYPRIVKCSDGYL